MLPRKMRPMRLSRRSEPFDSDQFIYELKIDGFRALAHIKAEQGQLVSRNGNVFRGFADLATWIAEHLRVESAVLDAEIACVDDAGRPVFRDLLFRQLECLSRISRFCSSGTSLAAPKHNPSRQRFSRPRRRHSSRVTPISTSVNSFQLLFFS